MPQHLVAANGTAIPVLGVSTLSVQIGIPPSDLNTEALVSDAIQGLILGVDWLRSYKCRWDLGNDCIQLKGDWYHLKTIPGARTVRKIVAAESFVLPPHQHVQVPVRVTWPTTRGFGGEWVVEPHEVRTGVIGPRMLIAAQDIHTALPLVNLSDSSCIIQAGELLGIAERVDVCDDSTNSATSHCRQFSRRTSNVDHVQCVIDALPASLSAVERRRATNLIVDHADLFSRSENDLGRTNLVKHSINTVRIGPSSSNFNDIQWRIWRPSMNMSRRCGSKDSLNRCHPVLGHLM